MLRSCIPEALCDVDDILLLEEISREITGQTSATPLAHNCNEEASVRLIEVKGVFRNRLPGVGDNGAQHASLEGVRLVVAILKDSQIVSVSTPSKPLWCRRTKERDGFAFEAQWEHAGSTLSFDHSAKDTACYEMVLALVNANQTKDNFLLACPCGETMLRLSQHRKGGRRELPIFGRPSPRNFVLFPCFRSNGGQSSFSPTYSNTVDMEEKKTESCRGDSGMELPFLSLEKATLGIEVSWQEKEMDVEVYYTGQDVVQLNCPTAGNVSNQQQFLANTQPRGYSLHRFPKDEYSGVASADSNDRDEESLLSVRVGELDSLARQQLSPVIVYYRQSRSSPSANSDLLEDVMRALDLELQEEADKSGSRPVPQPPDLAKNQHADTAKQRSVSDITLTTKESHSSTRAVSDGTLAPKPKRNWSNAFRKGSFASKNTSSSMQTLEESVLTELAITLDDQTGVSSPEQKYSPSRKEKHSARKELFSGLRAKSIDRKQGVTATFDDEVEILDTRLSREEIVQMESKLDALADSETEDGDVEGRNDSERLALSTTPVRSTDEDTVGAIRLLDSFCSNGDEVAYATDDELPPRAEVSQREASHLTQESEEGGVTWVSHESAEPVFRKPNSLSKIVEGALLTPHTLCTSLSDVTMDYPLEQKRSLEKNKPLEHYRSLDSFLSQKSTKSDEITTLSKIEDRMIMNAYHACGGRHIDRVTDAILRSAPRLFDGWLDSGTEETMTIETHRKSDDSIFSMNDVDFERATTVASQALSRQLTTITEESETRGLHAGSSSSTELLSSKLSKDQGIASKKSSDSIQSPLPPQGWVRAKASF